MSCGKSLGWMIDGYEVISDGVACLLLASGIGVDVLCISKLPFMSSWGRFSNVNGLKVFEGESSRLVSKYRVS